MHKDEEHESFLLQVQGSYCTEDNQLEHRLSFQWLLSASENSIRNQDFLFYECFPDKYADENDLQYDGFVYSTVSYS